MLRQVSFFIVFAIMLAITWPIFDGANGQGIGASILAGFATFFLFALGQPIVNRITRPAPIVDPDLGTFAFDDSAWKTTWSVDGRDVEITVDGDRRGMDQFAKAYFRSIRPSLPDRWREAIAFAQAKLKEWNAPWSASTEDFELGLISVHEKESFDGGHLVFYFDVRPDPNGSYYVSFRDERPFTLHRDS